MPAMIPESAEQIQAPDAPRPSRRLRSTQEGRDRRRRMVTGGLSVLLTVLLVNALFGENGYLASLRARRDIAVLQSSVATLRFQNQTLQDESRRLRKDPLTLEETARRELGLIKPGETLIILRDAAAAPDAH